MLLNENESKAICDKLLGFIKADDAEVSVFSEDFSHLRFAANGFTTSGRRENATAERDPLDQTRSAARRRRMTWMTLRSKRQSQKPSGSRGFLPWTRNTCRQSGRSVIKPTRRLRARNGEHFAYGPRPGH